MTGKLQFDLVSPERLLLSEEVDMVTLPGSEGEFGVLPGRAPVLSTLKPGVIVVTGISEKLSRLYVRGGFVEVNNDQVTVLAEEAVALSDLNADELDRKIKNTEEDLAASKSDDARLHIEAELEHLRNLRAAL